MFRKHRTSETRHSVEPIRDVVCVRLRGSVVEVERMRKLRYQRIEKCPFSSREASARLNKRRRRVSGVLEYSAGGDSDSHFRERKRQGTFSLYR